MKKLILTLSAFMVVGIFSMATAQIKTPSASPAAKTTQTVGLTDVTVEYSRPSVKGRTIFGGLVPYGEMWRTGANKNTMITFSAPVKIGGKDLKAGSYAIFTVPGQTEWEVIFYTDTENWGVPENWDATKEAVRMKVKADKMDFNIESFMVDLGDLTNDSFTLGIGWEKTWINIPVKLTTDEVVTASITKVMNGPSGDDFYAAGRYYFDSGKDLNKAYEWIHKSNEMDGKDAKFWKLRQESLVLAALGKYKDATAVAEKSLKLAVEAKNKDYERMNTASIAEWKKKM
jgi:hypothetical protein